MKRTILLLALLLALPVQAAINAGCVWEIRTTGAQNNGGGFVWTSLVNATYKWTASGSGTNEYYCEAAAGGDPSLTASGSVCTNGNFTIATEGTAGSLTAGQYDWADNDGLGYTTLYVRLANGLDPDAMIARGQPGYVSYGGGGTDYSQQGAAQRSWLAAGGTYTNDLSITNVNPSVVTSASYSFAAADKSNLLYLSAGTNVTVGWYQIVSVAAGAATLDRNAMTGAPSADASGHEGGAFLIGGTLDQDFTAAKTEGNNIYIAGGSYTLGETIRMLKAGSYDAGLISWIGYKTTRGDSPTGDDRPLMICGNYELGLPGNFGQLRNVRATGTGDYVIFINVTAGYAVNCQAVNTNAAAAKHAFILYTLGYLIGCEGQTASSTGSAIYCNGSAGSSTIFACYAHDSVKGITLQSEPAGAGIKIVNSIIDTCTTGISLVGYDNLVSNCTVYNCTTGIQYGGDDYGLVVNTIIDNCTTGIEGNSPVSAMNYSAVSFYNCLDNTTDFVDALNGRGDTFADPGLNDPANADFSIDASDTNVYEQGVDVGYFTTAKTYKE